MKRLYLLGLLAVLILSMCAWAAADPVLTDGRTMAWIGDNNYLYLKTESGSIRKLSMTVRDLLSYSETELYCLMEGNNIYAIKRDGSGSSTVARSASQQLIEDYRDGRYSLQEGDLYVDNLMFSNSAIAATTDGGYVYYVMKIGTRYRLGQAMTPTAMDSDDFIEVANLNGMQVIEPKEITVSEKAVVITAPDHRVMVISLETGESQELAAGRYQTESAAWIDGKLYRYWSIGEELWELETTEALAEIGEIAEVSWLSPVTTSRTTATPTPRVTPTPTPRTTPTPRVTATPTPTPDGTLRKGDYGSEVRSAQRRLLNLGYPVGNVDGVYGEETQKAVNLFYDAIGEKEREYMSEKMLTKLYSRNAPEYDEYRPLKKGESGQQVRWMQQRLGDLGFSAVKLDGIYGNLTTQAVALFQAANGIEPEAGTDPGTYASRETLILLYSGNAVSYEEWQAQGAPMGETTRRGWEKSNTSWMYYDENGTRVTGWKEIDGHWYYFDDLGVMLYGWQKINGNWYYLDKDKGMVKGWFEDIEAEKKEKKGKLWYWFDENGVMATDWVQIDGQWYYFDQSGVWQENVDGNTGGE